MDETWTAPVSEDLSCAMEINMYAEAEGLADQPDLQAKDAD
ncbi:MAG: pyrroloquinoline quinone precursor peptide PqqA [Pseudomonadota bacterium]